MTLQQSVDKILENGSRVTERFYELFFQRCPEVQPLFSNVHITTQAVMLTMTLKAIREHPEISEASKLYLQVLGNRHQRAEIPKELYPAFVDSLLVALEEFHRDDWGESLERHWRAAFENAAALMHEGYGKRFHV